MDYELAKHLKDAGFLIKEFLYDEKMQVIYPSLSELIAACGNGFYGLARADDGSEWKVFGKDISSHYVGNTPEEAVAKLWLALNAK